MSRVCSSFEPVWLGGATGRGAKPPSERSVPSRCFAGFAELGIDSRRQIAEATVRSDGVVVVLPGIQGRPGVSEREQGLVQELVP
jgi:hypothetical protein